MDIDSIISKLTIDEKIALLSGNGTYDTKPMPHAGIPSITLCDGPHGVRKRADFESTENLMHKSSTAVCYPCLSALGNSWDVELLEQVGAAIGREARDKDVQIVLGPGVNLKRNPLCGRNFEYLSEDPLLSGELGAAWVTGIQSEGIGASVKHFCCNNQETLRMTQDSLVDERTLRELYLKSFEIVVKKASPASLMCAYNRVNGVFMSDHEQLMKEILFGEWGYSGFVVTDWGAMNDRVAGIRARVSLEMPDSLGRFDADVKQALTNGDLKEADLDECLRPLLKQILLLREPGEESTPVDLNRQHAIARKAAAQSAVLLKNAGVLPLKAEERVCVIGAFAKHPRYQGTGSSRVTPYRAESLLDGLNEIGAQYSYAAGFSLKDEPAQELADEAVCLAKGCDKILLTLGLPEAYESEGFDREALALPTVQNKLAQRLFALGIPVAIVLFAGGAVEIPWADRANAILFFGLGGEASGTACADVLYGAVNPSGKLAESWPTRYEDHVTSTFWGKEGQQVCYREGIYVGYRYYDTARIPVCFAFGHGLSYTSFTYSELMIEDSNSEYNVSFLLKNTGDYDGSEVVQLYIHAYHGAVKKPEQELKVFRKVFLHSGEETRVTIPLSRDAFLHYDALCHDWQTENGVYEIRVGGGSRDIRLSQQVIIQFGQAFDKDEFGWYGAPNGAPPFADFERLYGKELRQVPPYKKGTFDWNASLGELSKYSFLARIILWAGRKTIAKGLGIKPDLSNPEYRMMTTISETAPLRNLALSSPKVMSRWLVRLLLITANGSSNRLRKQKV